MVTNSNYFSPSQNGGRLNSFLELSLNSRFCILNPLSDVSRSIYCIFIQNKKYELIHRNIVSHKVLIYFKHFSSISLIFIWDCFGPRYCFSKTPNVLRSILLLYYFQWKRHWPRGDTLILCPRLLNLLSTNILICMEDRDWVSLPCPCHNYLKMNFVRYRAIRFIT